MTTNKVVKTTGCYSSDWIKGFVQPPEGSALVSIRDPHTNVPNIPPAFNPILYLAFHDCCSRIPIFDSFDEARGDHEYIDPASPDQIDAIYNFIVENQDKPIFANCPAGISRSAAVREFLLRHGWKLARFQTGWQTYPNVHVLTGLERREREHGKLRKDET